VIFNLFEKVRQVDRVVREVGIHLKNIFVIIFQDMPETIDVSLTQSFFLLSVKHEDPIWIFSAQLIRQLPGSVGRVVVNNKHVQLRREVLDLFNKFGQISALVVSWNDDNCSH
jgi:hypothetical protein